MRVSRAVDKYLATMRVERDFSPGSISTYARVLGRLDDDHPDTVLTDFEGYRGTERLRDTLARYYAKTSSATRANAISTLHSFFGWLEAEDLIEANPATRIHRPPVKRPDVYRPPPEHLRRIRLAATEWELPTILLLEGAGLRATEACNAQWRHLDLTRGRLRVLRKGGNWQTVPLLPDVLEELRRCHTLLDPQPDWHLFTSRTRQWAFGGKTTVEMLRDPRTPANRSTLTSMLWRVCDRANVRRVGPHALRHGFAMRLRRQGVPLDVIQRMLGHKRIETTQRYLDELSIELLEDDIRAAITGPANPHSSTGTPHYALRPESDGEAGPPKPRRPK